MTVSLPAILALVLLGAATLAAFDLRRQEEHTLVVYTTPALKAVLEGDVVPRFQNETGERVELVYVAAGEQYNRLRMSGDHPEADVFLHASPLFIEKGYAEGYFTSFEIDAAPSSEGGVEGRQVEDGRVWRAFAWSPLVEVYAPHLGEAPDLARDDVEFGFPDPLLSNNGVYVVLYFETLDREAGQRLLAGTRHQPANAAATIGGITDASFDVTLGYEAVALLYQGKGAQIAFDLPRLDGKRHVIPVVMTAGLVQDHPHRDAERFLRFLFTDETQGNLARNHYRSIRADLPAPERALDLEGVERVEYDWSRWAQLEEKIPDYLVGR